MMAAHLRLPESQSDADKEAYVDSLIARLGMSKSAHTIVGDAKARAKDLPSKVCRSNKVCIIYHLRCGPATIPMYQTWRADDFSEN